jgi:hypothetical protein
MDAGMVGGIAGGVIGCMGGAIGTYFSVVNASRPRERALTIRFAAACWLWLAAVAAWTFVVPRVWLASCPPAMLACSMTLLVPWCNRRLAEARAEDQRE